MRDDENIDEALKTALKVLPDKPGVYQFLGKTSKIIYVGKAKSLKKRVTSYFTKDRYENQKTAVLVSKIVDLRYVVVETEMDALFLENNLIKKYQPRYNVQLKDDKSFPWIRLTNERFPRVYGMRNPVRDGSQYFGPYASVKAMNTMLELIQKLYPLRTCNLKLSEENIEKGKFKICLEYHIGNCKGPCEGLQTEEDYNESIENVKNILKGNIREVTGHFEKIMKEMAANYEFEKAQVVKDKLDRLVKFQAKTTIVNPSINNIDVYGIVSDDSYAYVNFMKVANGSVIQSQTVEMKKALDESDAELLAIAIGDIRQRYYSDAKEIIVPIEPELELEDVKFHIAQRGDKKSLLDLSIRNAMYYKRDKEKQIQFVDPDRHTNRIMEQMQKDLRMNEKPTHIECFDNSNIQGAFPVAAMVVFKDGKPAKSEYRHFNIKTVEGPDDFASMEEVVYRRYKRLLDEKAPLPQLIVIDGGKGQLSSAVKSLDKLGLRGKITIIGIAKKLEEIFFPGDSIPLYIDKKSETLKVIQNARNEAHRFGITHHRKRRAKGTVKTELTNIKGISDTSAKKLLSTFKSVKKVREASLDEIAAVVGNAKAQLVMEYFKEAKA